MIEGNTDLRIGKRRHDVRSRVIMANSDKAGKVGRLTLEGSTVHWNQGEWQTKASTTDASVILELTLGDFMRLYQQMHDLNATILRDLDNRKGSAIAS